MDNVVCAALPLHTIRFTKLNARDPSSHTRAGVVCNQSDASRCSVAMEQASRVLLCYPYNYESIAMSWRMDKKPTARDGSKKNGDAENIRLKK